VAVPIYFAVRGRPEFIRSDNGPEFVAKEIRCWLDRAQVGTLHIGKASPWENGYVESFNGKLRDELLNRELFLSVAEARYVVDEWRLEYNHRRPHGGIDWKTPAAFAAATLAGPPVGAPPLPAGQPTDQQPILS
jgi:putative transposase